MSIIGQQKVKKFLDKSIEKDIIFGAYIFTGLPNAGKFETALEFAQKIIGGTESKTNPDIIIIAPEEEEKKGVVKKKDIKVERIREVERALGLSSHGGGYRVAIIKEADRLTVAAQNALLKTLEEPNKKTAIILIVCDQEKILPTVRSRCVIKKFNSIRKKEFDDGMIKFKEMLSLNLTQKLELAENLSRDTSKALFAMDQWMIILRDNLLYSNGGVCFFEKNKQLSILEEIMKTKDKIQNTKSNPRYLLEKLFLSF